LIKALGSYIAVYYPPGGFVDLYEKRGSELKRVSSIASCITPDLADAYSRQRAANANPTKSFSLATDVAIRGDTIYVINNRMTKSGEYGVQRFLAKTGADLGAITMNAKPVELPYDLRFGNSPTEIISFSQYSGTLIRFDASRRVNP
jgi:hypothetical protein